MMIKGKEKSKPCEKKKVGPHVSERHRKNLSKESENRETQTREGVAARLEGHGHSGEREFEPGPHGWQGDGRG